MLEVHVFIHVKPEYIDEFKNATIENAKNSIMEEGVARFDFIQQMDDSSRFLLIEVYGSAQDAGKHKETDHYIKWKDTVADMMAEPRTSIKYTNIFPTDKGWQ